ncbi:MAG: hypothetical protein ABEJ73_05400 [Haloplanus sp.]
MGDDDADAPDATPPGEDGVEDDRAPLDDLAREVRARREGRAAEAETETETDTVDVDGDLFEPVDVAEVDDEAVWESFVEGETGPEDRVGVGADVRETAEPAEHVVPKAEFCQRCPHFADPPETACTHPGTTIVEVVDVDHFRVRDCPIVDEERGAASVD